MSFLKKLKYILPAFILLYAAGCKKKPLAELPVVNWEKYTGIPGPVSLMNSAFYSNHLNVLGTDIFFKNAATSPFGPAPDAFHMKAFAGAGRWKYPVSDQFYFFTDADKLMVRSALTKEGNSVERTIDLKTIDPDFYSLLDVPYWQGECLGLTKSDFLLLPYRAVKDNHAVPTPYFILLKIQTPVNSDNELKVDVVKLIREDLVPGTITVNKIQSILDCFFVSMGAYTYRVDTSGNISMVSSQSLSLFQKGNELFAFAPNLNTSTSDYFQSSDQGRNWTLLGQINEPLLSDLQYAVIDNKVIGFIKAQLFQFDISGNTYSVRELKNEGLGLSDITSISMTNDKTVFITTHCNAFDASCGAYYKPLDHFFEEIK